MKSNKSVAYVFFGLIGLGGCAAIKLNPNANRVIASKNGAPKGCKYLGSVLGTQGGAFVGGWTSNQNLAEGSMNDLKNKAAALNANYVQIETDRAGVTGTSGGGMGGDLFGFSGYSSGSSQQTDVTLMGNAYYCDPREIGLE